MISHEKEFLVRLRALRMCWEVTRLKVPLGRRILVLTPHPDDESMGAGGLLLAHRGISEIHIVNIFNGDGGGQLDNRPWTDDPVYRSELVLTRRKELETVGRILRVASIQYLDLADGQSVPNMEDAKRLKKIIISIKPDVMILPWYLDNIRDHRAANILYSWACQDLECMVLGFEIWSLCLPNAVFDYSEYLEEKMSLIETYKTQNSYINYANYIRSLGVVRGFLHASCLDRSGASEAFFTLPNRDYCDLIHSLYGRPGKLSSLAHSYL